MNSFIVRPMEPGDVEAVALLEAEIFTRPWSCQGFLDAITGSSTIFLVAESHELLGYCGMYCGADEGEITNVAVSPSARRRGIGGALLDRLLMESRKAGICNVILEVRVSNEEAIRLYQKKGFTVAGLRKNFYECPAEDGYVMSFSQ